MHQINNTSSNDDIARLFREHGNIGHDSSLWLRPLRQLIKNGKPVGQTIVLTLSMSKQQKVPLGILTETKRNRLIFWPILPQKVKIVFNDEEMVGVFDHITLEFPSEKIHVTAYNTNGEAIHNRQSWKTHRYANSPLALWFILLVRIPILCQQDMAVQRRIKIPTTDKERRLDEISRYIRKLSFKNIKLQVCNKKHDCICCILYLAPESFTIGQFPHSVIPINSLASAIQGWSEEDQFQTKISILKLDQRTICLATACPPGILSPGQDVSIGFPQHIGVKY